MRENEKEITLLGKEFQIRKFNPQAGCYWAFQLFGNLSSLDGGNLLDKIASFVDTFVRMDQKRFAQFQKDCLSHVSVKYPTGWHPFIRLDGNFESNDVPLISLLMVNAFMFTVADFFDPALLESLGATFQTFFPTDGSGTSSSSPSEKDTGDNANFGTAPTP